MLQTINKSEEQIIQPIERKNALLFDEFLEFYHTNALPKFIEKIEAGIIPKIHMRSATSRTDAAQIIEIYNELYNGLYPYREMLDPEYLIKKFKDPNFHTIVFEIPETGEIAGCMKLIVDPQHRTGYVRGFMVKPKFMGKIDASVMCMMLHEWAERDQGAEFDLVYSEIRTVHPKSQAVCLKNGYRPAAFFANKDDFKGERETDILIVNLKQRALDIREKEVKLIPQAMELFSEQNAIYEGKLHHEYAQLWIGQNEEFEFPKANLIENILVEELEDEYGYINFSFRCKDAWLKGLYTPRVGAIEKIEYEYETPEEFALLMMKLREYYIEKEAWHCEVFASASRVHEQEILYALGFGIVGYAVAWRCISDCRREDAVVFAMVSELPNKEAMDLIPEFERFYTRIYSEPKLEFSPPNFQIA
jgi:RimJ/RimL family protein N-acetyltransferase